MSSMRAEYRHRASALERLITKRSGRRRNRRAAKAQIRKGWA